MAIQSYLQQFRAASDRAMPFMQLAKWTPGLKQVTCLPSYNSSTNKQDIRTLGLAVEFDTS